MEAIGVISRSVVSFSGATGIDAYSHPYNTAASSSSFVGVGWRKVCRRTRKFAGLSSCEFRQNDHLDYYSSGGKITCGSGVGGKKEKCVKKDKEYKATQKRLIMLEGLSMFSSHGFAVVHAPPDHPDNVLFDQAKAKMVAGQFKQRMKEDKELKIRRKVEKMRLKMQTTSDCELSSTSMSSSSSESSDSDCEDVVDMNAQNVLEPVTEHESLALPRPSVGERVLTNSQVPVPEALPVIQSIADQEQNSTTGQCVEIRNSVSPEQGCCVRPGNVSGVLADNESTTGKDVVAGDAGASSMKIEVCMGGKCKKSGAAVLLGEFQRLVGIEGAVSVCKCMGKCRDGPNVRILNDHVKTATTPLCIGVGLEDVDTIVANFIGESSKLRLAA